MGEKLGIGKLGREGIGKLGREYREREIKERFVEVVEEI